LISFESFSALELLQLAAVCLLLVTQAHMWTE